MTNRTNILVGVAAVATGLLLPACGGSDMKTASAPPPTAQTQIKDSTPTDVLALAKASSETSDPLTVSTDALAASALDDETSDPIPVS